MTRQPLRKPDGTTTTSVREYFKAWKAIARPIEKATNSRLFAYNPGFSFYRLNSRQSTWDMEVPEATVFAKTLLELEQCKKEKQP